MRFLRRMFAGLVIVVLALAAFAAVGWTMTRFTEPGDEVSGPAFSAGLPSACSMAPDVVRRVAPRAVASDRTLLRHIAECTLTAGDRVLRIEVTRHVGFRPGDAATKDLARHRSATALLTRRWQPPLQDVPGVGDEAYLARLPTAGGAASTLTARRGTFVVVVRYQAPPEPPRSATADVARYAAVDAVATEVLRAVLAGL